MPNKFNSVMPGLPLVAHISLLALLLAACGTPALSTASVGSSPTQEQTTAKPAGRRLRLATTTSTQDSGLLDVILPDFEQRYGTKVDVVAVGTGQALKLGENGDADVVLVHARKQEDAFVAKGFGINRRDVMYNDFVIVGPAADPAGIKGSAKASDAFKKIAATGTTFFSRGDNSGTYTKEQSLWTTAGITPTAKLSWYKSLGQGMGETLIATNEQQGYTLSDRGTFLSMRSKLPSLTILVGGETINDNKDKGLLNPYGVIPVNPARHKGIEADLAEKFAEWITSDQTQQMIGRYGKDRFGQPLFYPDAKR